MIIYYSFLSKKLKSQIYILIHTFSHPNLPIFRPKKKKPTDRKKSLSFKYVLDNINMSYLKIHLETILSMNDREGKLKK